MSANYPSFYETHQPFPKIPLAKAVKLRKELRNSIKPEFCPPSNIQGVTMNFHTPILRSTAIRQGVRKITTVAQSNGYMQKLWKPSQVASVKMTNETPAKLKEETKNVEMNFKPLTVTERKLKRRGTIIISENNEEVKKENRSITEEEKVIRKGFFCFKLKPEDEKILKREKAKKALNYVRGIALFRRKLAKGNEDFPSKNTEKITQSPPGIIVSPCLENTSRSLNSTLTNSPEQDQKLHIIHPNGKQNEELKNHSGALDKSNLYIKLQMIKIKENEQAKPLQVPKKEKKRRATTQSDFESNMEKLAYGPLIK